MCRGGGGGGGRGSCESLSRHRHAASTRIGCNFMNHLVISKSTFRAASASVLQAEIPDIASVQLCQLQLRQQ